MAFTGAGFFNPTVRPTIHGETAARGRVDFVDYGKGMCIILVVMMHSTLGVGAAMGGEGWMHYAVEFSKPFRMPDFFLIAGLFLAATIDAPWRRYIDRKVVHFLYFYALWTVIQLTVKIGSLSEPGLAGFAQALAWTLVEPFATLWFIYILPIFFLVTRLTRPIPWYVVFAAAALLEMVQIQGYGMIPHEFSRRFVYFYAGYIFAPQIFAFARYIAERPLLALPGLLAWALVNGLAVFTPFGETSISELPLVSLALGFTGAMALICVSALLARRQLLGFLAALGERTLIVYLAFFLFMAATRIVLVRIGLIDDIGTISAIVTVAGLVGPLILAALAAHTPLRFLFERPAWARLEK